MSENTGIQWTDATWNPIRGCSRVSEGCRNCYAEAVATRFSGPGQPYEGLARRTSNGAPRWTGKILFVEKALDWPLRWRGSKQARAENRSSRIFVNSMSDLFHEDVPFEFIDRVFAVMAATPRHTFQVLTKRAERMRNYCDGLTTAEGGFRFAAAMAREFAGNHTPLTLAIIESMARDGASCLPFSNVWLGVSVENQEYADQRIPLLLKTLAAVRFVSYEPALGPVDFTKIKWAKLDVPGFTDAWSLNNALAYRPADELNREKVALDWVIVGGESGPGSRPFDLTCARSIVEQCKAAGVACFVKQLGAKPWSSSGAGVKADHLFEPCGHVCECCDECPSNEGQIDKSDHPEIMRLASRKGGDMSEWPEDLRVREFPVVAC